MLDLFKKAASSGIEDDLSSVLNEDALISGVNKLVTNSIKNETQKTAEHAQQAAIAAANGVKKGAQAVMGVCENSCNTTFDGSEESMLGAAGILEQRFAAQLAESEERRKSTSVFSL